MIVHPESFMGYHVAQREPGDIDDWVERWHEIPPGMSLPDFLGMTSEEYTNWAIAPETLPHIIATRQMVERARVGLTHAVHRYRPFN